MKLIDMNEEEYYINVLQVFYMTIIRGLGNIYKLRIQSNYSFIDLEYPTKEMAEQNMNRIKNEITRLQE